MGLQELDKGQWQAVWRLVGPTLTNPDDYHVEPEQIRGIVNGLLYGLLTECGWQRIPARWYGDPRILHWHYEHWNYTGAWRELSNAVLTTCDPCFEDAWAIVFARTFSAQPAFGLEGLLKRALHDLSGATTIVRSAKDILTHPRWRIDRRRSHRPPPDPRMM